MHSIRIFILIFIIYLNFVTNDGKHLCHPCHGRNCDLRIANCPYGDVKNDCDEYVCAKGPGEECSKHAGGMAVCQEGLMCHESYGICVGCLSRLYPGIKDHCFPKFNDETLSLYHQF